MEKQRDNLVHEISNSIETVLMAIHTIESKVKDNDIDGALYTIKLIKEKKTKIQSVIKKIKEKLDGV